MREDWGYYELGDFKFEVELDTGSSPDNEVIIWVAKNGKPLPVKDVVTNGKLRTINFRVYFPMNVRDETLYQYCLSFSHNEIFRQEEINKFRNS